MICNTYVQFFKTLADPAKLAIIKRLREGPCNVGTLSEALGHEQSRVSHNLRKLKELGFVAMTPEGKQRVYSIDTKTILPLLRLIDRHVDSYYKHYCRCSDDVKEQRWKQQ